MVTPQSAEKMAQEALQNYVNSCDCRTQEDVANVLMKMASMCGLAMCGVVGPDEATARMQGTADRVAKEKGKRWAQSVIQ